jgi:hypothetical protein
MHNLNSKFMVVRGAAGYGDRIYVHVSQTEARKFLADHSKWGNYDKSLRSEDGDKILGFEFGEVEFLVCVQAMNEFYNLNLLNREETIQVFNHYYWS